MSPDARHAVNRVQAEIELCLDSLDEQESRDFLREIRENVAEFCELNEVEPDEPNI